MQCENHLVQCSVIYVHSGFGHIFLLGITVHRYYKDGMAGITMAAWDLQKIFKKEKNGLGFRKGTVSYIIVPKKLMLYPQNTKE